METLILICFAIYFVSICAFFFLGMAIMKAQKNKEISELVRKIAENELDRRDKADSLRLALLDNLFGTSTKLPYLVHFCICSGVSFLCMLK